MGAFTFLSSVQSQLLDSEQSVTSAKTIFKLRIVLKFAWKGTNKRKYWTQLIKSAKTILTGFKIHKLKTPQSLKY